MAQFVLTDAYFSLNGTDLSDHVKSITINATRAELDDTAMGATSLSRVKGLKDFSISVEFLQDYAAAETDATVWACFESDANHAVVIRPVNGAVTATNPQYGG